MNKNNYLVIMAGGVGTRFWPMSKLNIPKQFIDILGIGKSLIRMTYERFLLTILPENIYVVTNEMYKDLVLEQIPELSPDQIICEPSRRNTAPCIAYATYKIASLNPEANFVVSPADHIIFKEDNFSQIIKVALDAVSKNDWLMTLGIRPTRPDTGYGYIQFKENDLDVSDHRIKKVKTFTEKPNLEFAKKFIDSGDFLWNSGIFVWSAKSIIHAFENFVPEISSVFAEGKEFYNTSKEKDFIKKTYQVCKNISIDYAVMEKAKNVFTFYSDFEWSDLGTWGSLYDISKKDNQKNAVIGNNVLAYETSDCIVNVPKDKLVVLEGLKDYIVVESNHILLICRKQNEQQIRQFVQDVKITKGEKFV